MDKTLNVFILAAGLGERLRPITDHIPKPLLPILGKPVLESVLENISTLPVNRVGINLHHKKDVIEAWIKQSVFSKKIKLFSEEPILGTGGALKNAEAFLSESTFLVHNSDILSDIDLAKLLETHHSSKNLVTLAVHDRPEFNHIFIDENGLLKGVGKSYDQQLNGINRLAFTGIAVYSPEFMKYLPSGASSVVEAWLCAIADSQRIGTLDVTGYYWNDIGTLSSYSSAVFDALRTEGETLYVHSSVKGCGNVIMQGHVVIENRNILKNKMSLKNCILLPESKLEENTLYEDCILGPGLKIDLIRSGTNVKSLIGTGGSNRKYYRTKKDKKTAVLMQCTENDPDFDRHIEYSRFFLKHSIPVPELLEVDRGNMMAVFEDLGDISLYTWLKCPREQEQIERVYKKVIDILVPIHTVATEHVSECPLLQNRVFDYEHFRWETQYFIERFAEGIRNVRVKNHSDLNKEFHELALGADSFSKTVIHRDFQSQNIMITDREIPRFIDYQGARIGPPAYDVVSLLWDPYYCLPDNLRENILNYYVVQMAGTAGWEFKEKDFMGTLLSCRLQRHMQALGAYGYLSSVKGKKYFLKYVPEGLRLLRKDVFLLKDRFPVLYELVMLL